MFLPYRLDFVFSLHFSVALVSSQLNIKSVITTLQFFLPSYHFNARELTSTYKNPDVALSSYPAASFLNQLQYHYLSELLASSS